MVSKPLRWSLLALLVCLLATSGPDFSGTAQAQSASALRRKKNTVSSQLNEVRNRLRNIKAEQATARNSLSQAQVELGNSQDKLRQVSSRLNNTRSTLKVVRKEHQQAQNQHQIQKKRMAARILAQYEAGNPTYLEVVLEATSFADFTERSELTQTIAERDREMLAELLATSQKLARQKALLEEKQTEEAALKQQVTRQRNEVAGKAAVAQSKLQEANRDRAEAERQLAAMEQASREIEAMLARLQRSRSAVSYQGTWSGSLLQPVQGRLTSGYGWRIHPITRTRRFHDGIDLATSAGTPIRAADKGRVVHAGWWGPYGIAVLIDHGSGISTLYGHCQHGSLRVSVGDVVSRGQVIAGVGSTGWSTGPHLHFGVRRYGSPIPPGSY
jgi:murein DD-endopeptidase MepM/ murein hydrolase activator NlpD